MSEKEDKLQTFLFLAIALDCLQMIEFLTFLSDFFRTEIKVNSFCSKIQRFVDAKDFRTFWGIVNPNWMDKEKEQVETESIHEEGFWLQYCGREEASSELFRTQMLNLPLVPDQGMSVSLFIDHKGKSKKSDPTSKPTNLKKDFYWHVKPRRRNAFVKDEDVYVCEECKLEFSLSVRRHHCRGCGNFFSPLNGQEKFCVETVCKL
jgi:hypothetical protein